MYNSKDLLVSCSTDKDCQLWSISHENCLKIFKGHGHSTRSMEILSEKIFGLTGAELMYWNIDSAEAIHSIKSDQSGKISFSLIKNNENELVFAGEHDLKIKF